MTNNEVYMTSIHGHDVLYMMEGNNYTETSLLDAIKQKFGPNAEFHTCSKQNMSANELIQFLKSKGKFKPVKETEFTVDTRKICNH